jgi:mono/diheme cytochrome c family protein
MNMTQFMTRLSPISLAILGCLALLAGCGKVPPPQFHANSVEMVSQSVSEARQKEIATLLEALYGTPDDPFVLEGETGLNLQKIRMSAGPVGSDKLGSHRGLFREHCVHCHGITGDGMGPTASFLKPYPRDYRQGWYKFKSTISNLPPTHSDLMRTLELGVPGTAMPSFKVLSEADRESLVEYVKYLSLRGQSELALITYVVQELDEKDPIPTSQDVLFGEILSPIVAKWKDAQPTDVPKPPEDFGKAESIARGKELFYTKGNCFTCHGPTALGDGQEVPDKWNEQLDKIHATIVSMDKTLTDDNDAEGDKKLSAEDRQKIVARARELSKVLDYDSLPIRKGQPRNLRAGIYRGGREPYELYYRLSNGIWASAMPNVPADMPPEDIWHLIDYVLELPYAPGSQFHTRDVSAPAREKF